VNIINKIKAGDKLLREEFINSYTPYIIRTVSNLTGKYVDVENSDEFSVGLAAFNEAIDSFDEGKNMFFFKFSTLVIKEDLPITLVTIKNIAMYILLHILKIKTTAILNKYI